MRPPGLAKTSYKHGVGSFEEPERHMERGVLFQLTIHGGKFPQCFSLPNVDDNGGFSAFILRFKDEFVKFPEKTDRKVIDAKETTVLESSKESSLPGAAQAGDDDERGWLHGNFEIESIRGQRAISELQEIALCPRIDLNFKFLRLGFYPPDVSVLPFVDDINTLGLRVPEN